MKHIVEVTDLTSTKNQEGSQTDHEYTKAGIYYPMLPLLKILLDKESEKRERESDYLARVCKNKGHYTKKDAQSTRNYLHKLGHVVSEYQCKLCNSWHLTHKIQTFRVKKRRSLTLKERKIFKFKVA